METFSSSLTSAEPDPPRQIEHLSKQILCFEGDCYPIPLVTSAPICVYFVHKKLNSIAIAQWEKSPKAELQEICK